jgi:3-hydroxybutyryl-CoA dehydratase
MSEEAGRSLEPGEYGLADVRVGDRYRTGGVTITEAHVVTYAGVSGDHYDIHMDDRAAQQMGFPHRIAHGLLGLALTDGLKVRAPVRFRAVAALGWNWKFRAPLLIGDRIDAEIEIKDIRPTKNPDRGVLTLQITVLNQDGVTIQEGESILMCLMHGREAGK